VALRYAGAEEWTYADYARLPADGRRYELHEGVLCMPPSPTTQHERVAFALATEMRRVVRALSLGEVFVAPYDVVLSDVSVVQPDVVFVSVADMGIVTEEKIRGAPDLVVEVLSPPEPSGPTGGTSGASTNGRASGSTGSSMLIHAR
jgi:Uma2 family endonuclease